MITAMLPNLKEMVTEKSTCEEVAVFLAGCLGENIAIEYEARGKSDIKLDSSRTFLVKLITASLARHEDMKFYLIELHTEGREMMTLNSKRPFMIKKCTPSTGHIF